MVGQWWVFVHKGVVRCNMGGWRLDGRMVEWPALCLGSVLSITPERCFFSVLKGFCRDKLKLPRGSLVRAIKMGGNYCSEILESRLSLEIILESSPNYS